ncbi:RNA pseudouridine synthase 5 isoform X2 [Prosopis cineraria]|uniref:RNA pseudouridine synthase 5 isoform X2 n=1 Tax=Prosopis cineraria TaxID=364024 RepID=UPI00240F4857|nr:RNA pseudouridine synthase 5 isoform X2 [Prosopis cineraria]
MSCDPPIPVLFCFLILRYKFSSELKEREFNWNYFWILLFPTFPRVSLYCRRSQTRLSLSLQFLVCWLQRIQSEQITGDGKVVTDPSTVLRDGTKLVYHRLPWKEPDAPYMIEVLYEDDDLIALNKPSGLQVLPGGLFQQRTVLTQLHWQANNQGASVSCQGPHPVPVHRLGRGTSGILLCAKTKLAKARLASYFADGTSHTERNRDANKEQGKFAKIYRALLSGIVDNDKLIIKQPIGTIKYPGVAKGLYVASPSGKPALSVVDVLERDIQGNCTLVQVQIQSGRPHQIRIHLSFIGHPLLGDPLYTVGGQPKCFDYNVPDVIFAQDGGYQKPIQPVPGDCGYHLHAHQLVISHPKTSEVIEIIAPLPKILQKRGEAKEFGMK